MASFLFSSLVAISALGVAQAGAIPRGVGQEVCQFNARDFNSKPQDEMVWAKPAVEVEVEKRDNSTWDPPSALVAPLKEVWDHEVSTYSAPLTFMNYGYDQVIAGKGKINYCVRWESTKTATLAQRQNVEVAIQRSFKKWIDALAGFDSWPYDTVDVNVVGWAVKSASLLSGNTSDVNVYTTTDEGGIAECDPRCGRFFHQDGDYSSCPGGADRHYDMSLWLTDGMDGGAGGDWGQRVGQEYFMEVIDDDSIHIVLHEMGHTFALDDFYDWTPTGMTEFIMNAGASLVVTEFDKWMARDWWRNLKSRYSL